MANVSSLKVSACVHFLALSDSVLACCSYVGSFAVTTDISIVSEGYSVASITNTSRPEQTIENFGWLRILDNLTLEIMKKFDDLAGSKPEGDPARQY